MIFQYEIPGRFLGRNESERLARSHWSKANEVKRDETDASMLHAKAAGARGFGGPVDVFVIFNEKVEFHGNGKMREPRDADNVQGAAKAVVDGLVKAGVVPDDNPWWVRRVIPCVKYVEDDPHITVVVADYEPNRTVTFPPVDMPEEEPQWRGRRSGRSSSR